MKALVKTCGIIALFLLGFGVALTVAGCALGGADKVSSVVNDVTKGKVKVELGEDGSFGSFNIAGYSSNDVVDAVQGLLDNKLYNIDDFGSIFDDGQKTLQGNVEKFMLSADEVEKLRIDIGGGELMIIESDDNDFWVEAKNVKKFQAYVKDDTLRVISTATGTISGADLKNIKITLSVPKDFMFDEVKMQLGAGVVKSQERLLAKEMKLELGAGEGSFDGISCDKLEATCGAASLKIKDGELGKTEFKIGAGSVEFEGVISDDVKVACGAGNLSMKLSNQYSDFDYKVECALGNVKLGEKKYSGLAKTEKIDNDADAEMKIECGAGNVTVSFE